jgi:hypothetical protein
VIKNM